MLVERFLKYVSFDTQSDENNSAQCPSSNKQFELAKYLKAELEELGLEDVKLAEDIKKYPLAKVESLYHIRHEDGSVQFFEEAIDSKLFSRTIVVKPTGWKPIKTKQNMEKIRAVRREAKEKVLIKNTIRALEKVSLTGNINEFEHVVLVGGSSMDFELGNMVTDALAYYGIVSGKANVRKTEGPRNAVATGLLLSYLEEIADGKNS